MTTEHEGAEGKLRLLYDWYESASTHHEKTTEAELVPDGDTIIKLVIRTEEKNFINGKRRQSTKEYRIEADKLIELIKEHQ